MTFLAHKHFFDAFAYISVFQLKYSLDIDELVEKHYFQTLSTAHWVLILKFLQTNTNAWNIEPLPNFKLKKLICGL